MSEGKMVPFEERFRTPSGQPKISGQDMRVVIDVRLCEPRGQHSGMMCRCPGTSGEGSECNRVAFRHAGSMSGPWIDCICGTRFNANYNYVGSTPWPIPPGGRFEVLYLEEIGTWALPAAAARPAEDQPETT